MGKRKLKIFIIFQPSTPLQSICFKICPEKMALNICCSQNYCFAKWAAVYLLNNSNIDSRSLVDEFFTCYGLCINQGDIWSQSS